jgi:hypothetical protein
MGQNIIPLSFRQNLTNYIFPNKYQSLCRKIVDNNYKNTNILAKSWLSTSICLFFGASGPPGDMSAKSGYFPDSLATPRKPEQPHVPRTCPRGRPTMIHLSLGQLAREFCRV